MAGKLHWTLNYTRALSFLVLIPSAAWFVLAVVRYFPEFLHEPDDLSLVLPFLYWLMTTCLALWATARPPRHFVKHAVRGVLEGALLGYVYVLSVYLSQPEHWSDGVFEWGTLFVGFLYGGMVFSLVGATAHCAVAAVWRWSSNRSSFS